MTQKKPDSAAKKGTRPDACKPGAGPAPGTAPAPEERTILINFVLDASGSMDHIRQATISAFNEFKNSQAREEGTALVTLTLFNTEFRTVCEAVPAREVSDLDHDTYRPDGCTALYDALAHTMHRTDDFVKAHKPDQVLFVIMTDGLENASREYTRDRVFQMIQDRQKLADYDFVYMGANQDSFAVGSAMGVTRGKTLDYTHTEDGAMRSVRMASACVSAHRRMGDKVSDDFFEDDMVTLGAIDPATWRSMSPSQQASLISDQKHASAQRKRRRSERPRD